MIHVFFIDESITLIIYEHILNSVLFVSKSSAYMNRFRWYRFGWNRRRIIVEYTNKLWVIITDIIN